MSGFPWAASLAVIRRLNPFFLMKKTRRRTACDGTGKGLCLEPRKGCGPWDGVVDPEGGNSVRQAACLWFQSHRLAACLTVSLPDRVGVGGSHSFTPMLQHSIDVHHAWHLFSGSVQARQRFACHGGSCDFCFECRQRNGWQGNENLRNSFATHSLANLCRCTASCASCLASFLAGI
jgi:hypothetical protein